MEKVLICHSFFKVMFADVLAVSVDFNLRVVSMSNIEGSSGIYNPLKEFNEGTVIPLHPSRLTFYWWLFK